ncbi:hypothetical protein GOV13_02095 [Candidatus Pacearchaeota archaeon]|nr:hypothetical protein [Candidatus Pacearchaeota archaeon]
MIFELKPKRDTLIENMRKKAMNELKKFWGIRWEKNIPRIIVWKTRKDINNFKQQQTKDWFIGEANGRNVFLLDRKNFDKESCHKYSNEKYYKLIKHELSHLFFEILSGGKETPYWLNEGITLYSADQINQFPPINGFSNFLTYHSNSGGDIYFKESGFAVELLIKNFGKRKILKLIKSLSTINSEKEFKQTFKKIYGFNLNYKEMNKLLKKCRK